MKEEETKASINWENQITQQLRDNTTHHNMKRLNVKIPVMTILSKPKHLATENGNYAYQGLAVY